MNYFGKMVLGGSGVGQITVYPILIKKVHLWMCLIRTVETFFMNGLLTVRLQGSTSVALYGLGNIRDERLNRMFQVSFGCFTF